MRKGRSWAPDALKEARRKSRAKGNALVLPPSMDATKCTSRIPTFLLWKKTQTLTGLEPKLGRGWHSLGRKFATRPDGPAAQGALRATRLEDGPDNPTVLTAG